MMESHDNLPPQSPETTSTWTFVASSASLAPQIDSQGETTTTVSSVNSSQLPWESLADSFLRQLDGQANGWANLSLWTAGSGVSEVERRTEAGIQLPFAAYQSLAAITTPSSQFPADSGGGVEGGGGGGVVRPGGEWSGGNGFVSMASPPSPVQLFFIVKVVIMCFIIVAAVFGNLLVIVSVMRHRKLR